MARRLVVPSLTVVGFPLTESPTETTDEDELIFSLCVELQEPWCILKMHLLPVTVTDKLPSQYLNEVDSTLVHFRIETLQKGLTEESLFFTTLIGYWYKFFIHLDCTS